MSVPVESDLLSVGIGAGIRRVRQLAGISMRALAQQCGVSQPFLSEVERGNSTPSIATLYRIADALGVQPSALLPSAGPSEIVLVRSDEGRRVPSSERPGSAVGRLVYADDGRELEVYEYRTAATEDLDVWFRHVGDKVLHLIEGELLVEFENGRSERMQPGDTLVHPGTIAHRWTVVGKKPVRLLLVITNTG